MTLLLEPTVRWWKCPSCGTADQTQRSDAHTQFHNCPALGGMGVPFVEVTSPDADPNGRHVIVEREDYVGDSGADRIASVRTERGDGSNDCTVFAPVAHARVTTQI